MAKILNYLGVDIGASGFKIVELTNEAGRARLKTYGFSIYKEENIDAILEKVKEKGTELASLCKEAGVSTKIAITGLPMSSVFTTILSLKEASEKELEIQIKLKAKKLSPIPEEDMVLDWKKVSTKDKEGLIKISATVASKKMIDKIVALFGTAGFTLQSLETESFALIRSLLGRDKALSIIIDIGAIKTNVLVVKESVPVIHKTIKIGGEDISKMLMEKMKVDQEKAEEIKKNFSLEKMESAMPIIKEITEPIINEIKFCQNLYKEQYNESGIEKLVLTGGTSLILGISEILQKEIGLRVFLGDPWARIIYPEELRPTLDKLGPKLAVAVGLAMRDII